MTKIYLDNTKIYIRNIKFEFEFNIIWMIYIT